MFATWKPVRVRTVRGACGFEIANQARGGAPRPFGERHDLGRLRVAGQPLGPRAREVHDDLGQGPFRDSEEVGEIARPIA